MLAKAVTFNFKSRTITDESGKEIGRTKKQDSVTCDIPVPEASEVIEILAAGGKESELILDAVAEIIVTQARDQFDEIIESFGTDDSKTVSASMLDYAKLSLTYIASIPPARRGATALSEEDWKSFFEDYLAVMVAATGKSEDRIKNQINLYKNPAKAKANKEVLNLLIDQLDIYMSSSANIEDTAQCASRISEKFKKWAQEPEKAVNLDLI